MLLSLTRRRRATLQPPSSGRSKSSSRLSASRKATVPDMREARPTASGDRSLIRALGLKIGRIVIDPGHGGHDTGTIGPNGLEEKDLVLEVGRRLGKLLETRLGAEVVYTRKDDTFIPLETRTAIANQQRADLFISIHANSSQDSGRPRRRDVLSEFHVFAGSAGSGGARKRGFGEIHLRTAGSGEEDRVEGKDRRVARICRRRAGVSAQRPGSEKPGHPQSWCEEGAVYRADRGEHAVDPGRDFVCEQSQPTSTGWRRANTASALPNRSIAESQSMRMG